MKSINYHNTTNQKAEFVLKESRNCRSQEQTIFDIFKRNGRMTASEVFSFYPKNVPLTSIRRAISNLKFEGLLLKLDETKIGLYEKPEHYYKLIGNQLILF